MEVFKQYTEYVNIVKNLKEPGDLYKGTKEENQAFEDIYTKANNQEVKVSTAKEFIKTLSSFELDILKKFANLSNEINPDKLSSEGAYNLLMHHYEKFDFNNDGLIEVGENKVVPHIPRKLSNIEKQALVDTFNSLAFKDIMLASMTIISTQEIVPTSIGLQYYEIEPSSETIKNRVTTFTNYLDNQITDFVTLSQNEEDEKVLHMYKRIFETFFHSYNKRVDELKKEDKNL
ncbi:hypothetical protein [Malaciobacter mytili]|uniref:EF-hand domain-containing protein n=1 Tax=Malaciobacter mytili LMG 24559 TaxID=1032238 RepID=A0AAX2AH36_9BACT|nr:hypothetical protein [Malaciobacter mytili]AXH13717.1 hypothetical protein AMYT_0091 [Malaciobacter mytili LMG 24559]RXK16327.1 hypothetical protein CP985_04000 [Malaciobacter mytili LMG 24559]